MGKIPFRVRPVNFKYEPEDPSDFSGNVTLSSKFVGVNLSEIVETLRKKDISNLLAEKGGEEVILRTNTVLRLSNAPNATVVEDGKKYWAAPALLGFFAGMTVVIILGENVPALLLVTVSLAAVFGGLIGYIWQKFYEIRIRKVVRQLAQALLED